MNSANISGTLSRIINNNTEQYSVKGMTCNFLKKIFKCDRISGELDDYETKENKSTKLGKGMPLFEYIIPFDAAISSLYFQVDAKGKKYLNNPISSLGFHGKIHLRPPQNIS
ncbi:hypothetical protein [Flavobacterium daemonense]|uniref:hypothetical protein n=1 Tax=Flavobacterium daemonense TaxID=1393049 RepID=UPI001FE7AB31|nr:hypothetical protein [Flavobacterium daemonense]